MGLAGKLGKIKKSAQRLILATGVGVASSFLTGCEKEGDSQYVSPDTADVRGTWYDPGSTGGWFGPDNRWGFEWYYLEQYGTNIEGKTEFEFYEQNDTYGSLQNLKGNVNGNKISLTTFSYDNTPDEVIEATVNGGVIQGRGTYPYEGDYYPYGFFIQQVSPNIERRRTPWASE